MSTLKGRARGDRDVVWRRFMRRIGVTGSMLMAFLMILPTSPTYGFGQVGQQGNAADFDARTGSVAPTASQISRVNTLSASVEWNRFGTPHSLIRYGGYLSSGLSGATAVDAARAFIETNKSLFKLNSTSNTVLEAIGDNALINSSGHAVLFRQKFGSVPAAQDGMITVGIVGSSAAGWKVAYVSSTSAGSQSAPASATISPAQAWLAAAHDVGLPGAASDIAKQHADADWSVFGVHGYPQLQRARLRALPIPGGGVRPVFETDVQMVQGAQVLAYVSMVDAVTKKIWLRWNATDEAAQDQSTSARQAVAADAPVSDFFAGTAGPAPTCGPLHPIPTDGTSQSIDLTATANLPANDIILKLILNGTITVVSEDTGVGQEAIHYAPSGGVPLGSYAAQVCPFSAGLVNPTIDYTGFWVVSDQTTAAEPYPPEWQDFKVSPKLDYSNTDTRIIDCWEKTQAVTDCNRVDKNMASRSPWDFDVEANAPTFTSIGNNAKTAEAWLSPLTPSENYSPPTPDRKYYFPWTNQWYTSKCNPTDFASPARADIDASIINLFVGHNRMHDFSYFLGFNEQAWNLQQSNFGNGQPGPYPGNDRDPELGNVQAGAVSGGAPSYRGRDNANQITLQDGVPGITNQYLFQPIAGGFYAPCVDGSFDFTVFGHEYTHAISNRMVGGPDSGLTGNQAGAMGESWSDLDALEYLHEFNYAPPGSAGDWVLGPYVTGNKQVGIRNFAINKNPLNFGDVGYDSACNTSLVGPPVQPYCDSMSEVHADGEIWNAVNYDIRAALVSKYNGSYPASNTALQASCATGQRPANLCPGNRRWIQIVYDAFLLMPPDVSMLGARDAYLAADVMRDAGANQKELWHAFASRGMGQSASTTSTDDDNPIPGWSSPKETNGKLIFNAVNESGQPVKANIFVGLFEARITPSADTDSTTTLSNQMTIVPGRYQFVASAPGYGHVRLATTATTGTNTITLHFYSNWASGSKGAVASGDGGNFTDLIDDTEGTDWAYIGTDSVQGKHVDVKLGSARKIDIVQVSAMLHQADDGDDYDVDPQNRFTALKSFEIWGCLGSSANSQCGGSAGWTKFKTFTNVFTASIPRPLMPDMLIKQLEVDTTMIDHVRLVVLDNQCTGTAAFHGELDNDPSNNTDCITASENDSTVHIAELQAMVEEPYATGGTNTNTLPATNSPGVNTTNATASPSDGADAVPATDATTDTTVQP